MTLIQIVEANAALKQLSKKEWDYASAHKLVMLKRKLAPHVEFYSEKEHAIAREYGEKSADGKLIVDSAGGISFTEENSAHFFAERYKLRNVEIAEPIEAIHIPQPDAITPACLEALERFIVFEEATNA